MHLARSSQGEPLSRTDRALRLPGRVVEHDCETLTFPL
jgi:hypothetical protein